MAIHVAETVEAAGAQVAVYGFRSRGSVYRAKGFNEKTRAVRERFNGLVYSLIGNTPLSESMLFVSNELETETDATERVLFALTDGSDNHGVYACQAAVRFAKARGQIVVGVLIGYSAKRSSFDGADAIVEVDTGDQLSGAILKQLADELTKRNVRKV